MARKPNLLYRREIDGKVLTLTEKAGVYELELNTTEVRGFQNMQHLGRISIALVDPTYSNPIQHARRSG